MVSLLFDLVVSFFRKKVYCTECKYWDGNESAHCLHPRHKREVYSPLRKETVQMRCISMNFFNGCGKFKER